MGKHFRPGAEPCAEIRSLTALEAHQFLTGVQTHAPESLDFWGRCLEAIIASKGGAKVLTFEARR